MEHTIEAIVEPLVQKGIFSNAEHAVAEMTKDFVSRQVQKWRRRVRKFERKYGTDYHSFTDSLRGRATMAEEEHWLDWKIAAEMLESWEKLLKEMAA